MSSPARPPPIPTTGPYVYTYMVNLDPYSFMKNISPTAFPSPRREDSLLLGL
jgi:hypothetical protein